MPWRCDECDHKHDTDVNYCANCGHDNVTRDIPETNAPLVWVCTNCGREHPKHAPPCSSCGSMTLEKQEQTYQGGGDEAAGYTELLLSPQFAGLAVGGLIIGLLVISGAGQVGLLTGGGDDVPAVEDVPGNETVTDNGIPTAAIEWFYLEQLDERFEEEGLEPLDRDGRIDDVASFENQQIVREEYGDGPEADRDRAEELLADTCPGHIRESDTATLQRTPDAAALADGLSTLTGLQTAENLDEPFDAVGIDVHAVDEEVHARVVFCTY